MLQIIHSFPACQVIHSQDLLSRIICFILAPHKNPTINLASALKYSNDDTDLQDEWGGEEDGWDW